MDLNQWWGEDLSVSASGDLLPVDGTLRGQQRVLRRLLTNPGGGDYPWHPEYGAGLPAFIGDDVDAETVRAVILSQIFLESAVARFPQPVIEVSQIPRGVFVSIKYVDNDTGKPAAVSFNLAE